MKTVLVLLPGPRDAAELVAVAERAAAWGNDRVPLVLAELPEAAGQGAGRPAALLRISAREPSRAEDTVRRVLETLAPAGVLAIDAWWAPEGLPETLRTIARFVFSMETPPAACVVFAPPAERFFVTEQLAGAFRLRAANSEALWRDVALARAAAFWLRWLGLAGLRVHRLIVKSWSGVRRLLAG